MSKNGGKLNAGQLYNMTKTFEEEEHPYLYICETLLWHGAGKGLGYAVKAFPKVKAAFGAAKNAVVASKSWVAKPVSRTILAEATKGDRALVRKLAKYSYELKVKRGLFTFDEPASKKVADVLGKGWIGSNARPISNGTGWCSEEIITADYVLKRTYRFAKAKGVDHVHAGELVANFQEYFKKCSGATRIELKNAHLIIKE